MLPEPRWEPPTNPLIPERPKTMDDLRVVEHNFDQHSSQDDLNQQEKEPAKIINKNANTLIENTSTTSPLVNILEDVLGALSMPSVMPKDNLLKPPCPESTMPPPNKKGKVTNQLLFIQKKVLPAIWSHKFSWPFKKPVDAVKLNLPDYHTLIKHPMDFGTIRKRLMTKYYNSASECQEDMKLVFSNCFIYNKPELDISIMGRALEKIFLSLMERIPEPEMDLDSTKTAVKRKGRIVLEKSLGDHERNPKKARSLKVDSSLDTKTILPIKSTNNHFSEDSRSEEEESVSETEAEPRPVQRHHGARPSNHRPLAVPRTFQDERPGGLLTERKTIKNYCKYCDQAFLSKYVRDMHEKVKHGSGYISAEKPKKMPVMKKLKKDPKKVATTEPSNTIIPISDPSETSFSDQDLLSFVDKKHQAMQAQADRNQTQPSNIRIPEDMLFSVGEDLLVKEEYVQKTPCTNSGSFPQNNNIMRPAVAPSLTLDGTTASTTAGGGFLHSNTISGHTIKGSSNIKEKQLSPQTTGFSQSQTAGSKNSHTVTTAFLKSNSTAQSSPVVFSLNNITRGSGTPLLYPQSKTTQQITPSVVSPSVTEVSCVAVVAPTNTVTTSASKYSLQQQLGLVDENILPQQLFLDNSRIPYSRPNVTLTPLNTPSRKLPEVIPTVTRTTPFLSQQRPAVIRETHQTVTVSPSQTNYGSHQPRPVSLESRAVIFPSKPLPKEALKQVQVMQPSASAPLLTTPAQTITPPAQFRVNNKPIDVLAQTLQLSEIDGFDFTEEKDMPGLVSTQELTLGDLKHLRTESVTIPNSDPVRLGQIKTIPNGEQKLEELLDFTNITYQDVRQLIGAPESMVVYPDCEGGFSQGISSGQQTVLIQPAQSLARVTAEPYTRLTSCSLPAFSQDLACSEISAVQNRTGVFCAEPDKKREEKWWQS